MEGSVANLISNSRFEISMQLATQLPPFLFDLLFAMAVRAPNDPLELQIAISFPFKASESPV